MNINFNIAKAKLAHLFQLHKFAKTNCYNLFFYGPMYIAYMDLIKDLLIASS